MHFVLLQRCSFCLQQQAPVANALGQAIVEALGNNYTEAVAQAIASAFIAGGDQASAYAAALDSIASGGNCSSLVTVLTRKCFALESGCERLLEIILTVDHMRIEASSLPLAA